MDGNASATHKFQADSGMTFEEVYRFALNGHFIPYLQGLGSVLGEGGFIETLKRASSEVGSRRGHNAAETWPDNSLVSLTKGLREHSGLLRDVQEYDIVEDTDTAFEIEVTECLWAKVFRESGASDIGCATVCHQDFAFAEGFNASIKLVRTKTLMQGDDCCDHRWVWEE